MENYTIKSLLKAYADKKVSPEEVVKSYFGRIADLNEDLNAYVNLSEELAMSQLSAGGPLAGVPMALKDVFTTKDVETTACSEILKGYVPSFNAPVVDRLYDAGAICLGKVNTDEFTCGASTETSCFGVTVNPYDHSRVSGGSSGGSAAVIPSNLAVFSMGTDTGGSIRQPASFCNSVGLKVTYGRVPRSGVISMASSLDTIGHFTKTVEDAAIVLGVTAGVDAKDLTSVDVAVGDYLEAMDGDVKGLRIGLPKEYFGEGVDPEVSAKVMEAVEVLKSKGAIVKDISLPMTEYAVAVYYLLAPAEISANMARYDGIRVGKELSPEASSVADQFLRSRGEGFGDEMKRRIMVGSFALSAGSYEDYYLKAQKVRTLICREFENAFKDVDVILGPVSPGVAFGVGELVDDPVKMYMADKLTIPSSCAGIPGISVPCGFVERDGSSLPVGLQILAPQFREDLLFKVGDAYERETEFWKRTA
jgi:aspartyl-tRNA(Asn)/glutamyl-tRNA(Gln) amidotransferase subunit A